MFSKLSILTTSVLITLAAAIPNNPPTTTISSVPPPTSDQCCASVVSSTSAAAAAVLGPLGILLNGLDIPVGLSCSPITVIGNNCGGTTVTCDAPAAEWNNLIAINCIPITL
ncbi:fungal hydrophobin [Roridomyces roridus]|uniref:Hydrophobin n=1 Tax=Roridomyces roridus TaxID=1738132 RepID=A0AAD7B4M8_9AGAR|nr:fungal hydrophobin [Roridomyces roridus]